LVIDTDVTEIRILVTEFIHWQ